MYVCIHFNPIILDVGSIHIGYFPISLSDRMEVLKWNGLEEITQRGLMKIPSKR